MNRTEAIALAKKYAKDIAIRIAGVTTGNSVVTTKESVDYQRSIGQLAITIDGNWKWYTDGDKSGYKRGRIRIIHHASSK